MKITKQRLKEIIEEEFANDDGLADRFTEPRYEGGTPEEKFLNKLTIAAHTQGAKTGIDAAKLFGLGDDPDVIAYLDGLINNPMYRE